MNIRLSYNRVAGFLADVGSELRKSEWPSRAELVDSTLIVVISVAGLGIFVGLSDFVLMHLLDLLVGR